MFKLRIVCFLLLTLVLIVHLQVTECRAATSNTGWASKNDGSLLKHEPSTKKNVTNFLQNERNGRHSNIEHIRKNKTQPIITTSKDFKKDPFFRHKNNSHIDGHNSGTKLGTPNHGWINNTRSNLHKNTNTSHINRFSTKLNKTKNENVTYGKSDSGNKNYTKTINNDVKKYTNPIIYRNTTINKNHGNTNNQIPGINKNYNTTISMKKKFTRTTTKSPVTYKQKGPKTYSSFLASRRQNYSNPYQHTHPPFGLPTPSYDIVYKPSYNTRWNYPRPIYKEQNTGDSDLGLFLGYRLGQLSTPSYHYYNYYYSNNAPVYDHYTIHHYYHGRNTVPKSDTIAQKSIVTCLNRSGEFCPYNTTSLCLNTGAVLCVASQLFMVPCTNVPQTFCVWSSLVYKLNGSNIIRSSQLPCLSVAYVSGNITYVNNNIVVANVIAKSTVATGNIPKREPVQKFCVTVLVLPAQRILRRSERMGLSGKRLVSSFLLNAFGVK